MRFSDWSSDVCSSDLGYSGVPFRIAANGAPTPDLWLIALNGRVNGVDVKTQSPARIITGADGYRLQPTVITFGKGSVTVARDFGKAVEINSRFPHGVPDILHCLPTRLDNGGQAIEWTHILPTLA